VHNPNQPIHKFSVRPLPGEVDLRVEQLRTSLGLLDLEVWPDFYLEFGAAPSAGDLSAVARVLGDGGIGCRVVVDEPLDPSCMVQVAHRRGVVDNESPSLVAAGQLLGLAVRAGKVATTYRSADPGLAGIVRRLRCNASVEELHEREPEWGTLVPAGRYAPSVRVDLRALGDAELAALGRAGGRNLSLAQMRQIRGIQTATGAGSVSDVLLEALDARWSDHCAHTTWRSLGDLLGRLVAASEATGNPNIVSMFVDNAGVWEFYGGWSLAIKAETHNGPSAVSAYFGQLTKLGGVLRDILGTGLGADPIGCFEYTATGPAAAASPVAGRPSPARIAVETIRAIKEYGNTFGVPMMSSRMDFHPGYAAKPFALGGSIGLIPTALAKRGVPQPGDLVVLIGALTGNEGMHGASASSAGATMDEAAVQIGAPLEQVKFRKAIIELRDAGCLRAVTDVGGAGLNSAVGEIGEPCGVWVNTALVPLKTTGLPMWRILLSESQERMILAVPPDRLAQARRITARHQVRTTVIGAFTGTGRYTVCHAPGIGEQVIAGPPPADVEEVGFDVPYALLGYQPPQRQAGPPPSPAPIRPAWPHTDPAGMVKLLEQVAADPAVASQHYADAQYDSTVQGNTVYGPGYGTVVRVPASYWAATPVDGLPAAVTFATAFAPALFQAHPVRALRQLLCGLLGRHVLAGVALADICLCDNFYTPHLAPHADAWLVAMVDELADLVRCFGTPVISGKDSSAGSTHTEQGLLHVPPAVFLSAMGKVPDAGILLREQWTQPGNLLVQIGPATPSPVGTAAARALHLAGNDLDPIDPAAYRTYLHALSAGRHRLASGTPIGPGGLAAALLHGTLAAGIGVDVHPDMSDVAALFAEHRCAALVEIHPRDLPRLPAALHPVPVATLHPAPGIRLGTEDLLTPTVLDRWTNAFQEAIT
jgi:phosphoribosylformylglycinamidine (FGAM) synthase-like enzyme